MLSMRDITKIIENQTFSMQMLYQEAMLATISHEQMNPLNSIINFTDYLKSKSKEYMGIENQESSVNSSLNSSGDESEEDEMMLLDKELLDGEIEISKDDAKNQLKILRIVLNSAMLMNLLNQAILNVTLISQSKFKPQFQTIVNPLETLREFIKLFSSQIRQKRLDVEVLKDIKGDRSALGLFNKFGLLLD